MTSATIVAMNALAQDHRGTTVPAVVSGAFIDRFPKAENLKWVMEDASTYEAEFRQNGVEYSANFSAAGEWMETEMEVSVSTLPEDIRRALEKDHPECKVMECERVERPGMGMNYEVELTREGARTELVYDRAGKALRAMSTSGEEMNESQH